MCRREGVGKMHATTGGEGGLSGIHTRRAVVDLAHAFSSFYLDGVWDI